jgi:radical SAM-linked protein
MVYSQGFNPRPKIQLAAALPLGYTSTCEILDVWLEPANSSPPEALLACLRDNAPPGLEVYRIEPVTLHAPALQAALRSATYEALIRTPIPAAVIGERVAALLAKPSLPRTRREKAYDLRPLIYQLELTKDNPPTLRMVLTVSQETGTGRPDEVLAALELDPLQAQISRTALTFDGDPNGLASQPPDPAP